MKSKQIKGILHDILHLRSWRNPLASNALNLKEDSYPSLKIDLLTGELRPSAREDDSLSELLKEKREWFVDFLNKHNAKLSDFEKAEIKMQGRKEVVNMKYKGKEFSKEKIWGNTNIKEKPKICKACKKPIKTSWYGIRGKIGLYCKKCFDKLPAKEKHVGTFQIKNRKTEQD